MKTYRQMLKIDRLYDYITKINFSIIIILASVLPIVLIGFLAKKTIFETIRSERIKTIGRVADAKHDQLIMLLQRAQTRSAHLLSTLDTRCNMGYFNEPCSIQLLNAYLSSEQATGATLYHKRIGKNITVGESVAGKNEIIRFKSGQYAKFFGASNKRKNHYFTVATNEFTGYQITVTYPVSNIQPIFDSPQELGSLGETFLSDADGFFVTEPKYESKQGQSHSIHANPMKSCLSGKNTEVLDKDYRDADVIHGYRFIPEFGGGCIMAHADQHEAFSEYEAFEKRVNIIAIISILGILALSAYISRKFLKFKQTSSDSKIKFHVLFESANDNMIILSLNGIIDEVNTSGYTALGYSKNELIGKHISQLTSHDYIKDVPHMLSMIIEQGEKNFEWEHLCKDGTVIPLDVNAQIIYLDGVQKIFLVNRDITERKRQEYVLHEREAKYRAVIETSQDGFWIIDLQGYIIEVNDAYVKRSGFTRDELLNMRIWDLTPMENTEKSFAHIQQIFKAGHYRYESYHKTRSGELWPVEMIANYSDSDEDVIFVFIHDITERKIQLQQLEDREKKFRTLFDNASDEIMILDLTGIIIDINESGHRQLGYTKEQMIGKRLREFISPDANQKSSGIMKALLADGYLRFESENVTKDGKIISVDVNAKIIEQNGEKYIFSVARDITFRKEIDHILTKRESKYRAIIETSADGFWITDMQGNFLEVNEAYLIQSGYSRDEILSMKISDVEAKENPEDTRAHIEKLQRTGHDSFETIHRKKDGTQWAAEIHVNYYNQENGLLFVFIHDITDRNKHITQLRDNENKFRTLFENASDFMILLDLGNGIILDVNTVTYSRLGYTKDELVGEPLSKIVSPKFAGGVAERIEKIKKEGHYTFESAHLCKDGTEIIVEVNSRLIEKDDKQLILNINRDITLRKEIEQMLSKREAKYRAVIETSDDGFFITDLLGNLQEVNDAYVRRSGYSKEELHNMKVGDLAPREIPQDMESHIKNIIENGHDRFESYHVTKGGRQWPVEIIANYWDIEGGRFFIFVHDITERKKFLNDLQENEEKFRLLFENASDFMVILDLSNGNIMDVNPAMYAQLGYEKTELSQIHISKIVAPEFVNGLPDRIKSLMEEGQAIFDSAYITKDGNPIEVEVNARVIERDGKKLAFSIARNIIARKLIENKLRQQDALSRAVIERILDS